MAITYQKVKSVAKQINTKGPGLSKIVLETMKTVSDIVGATLGPGGQPILIERFEHDLSSMVTKDGVTVFRSLGFDDAAKHSIMEAARDAAVRTASEAGDGTTTATILAEAIVRLTNEYCTRHPKESPQKVVRKLEYTFRDKISPLLNQLSLVPDSSTEEGNRLLHSVAKISANGEDDLADAVMKCFKLVGDEGNVTITEVSGPSGYEVEVIDGYPIPIGYEISCGHLYPKFINDVGSQMTKMENPVFVLYAGTINEIQTIYKLLALVGDEFEKKIQGIETNYNHHNVVVVAIGFSESVLGTFAAGFNMGNTIRVFPLVVPKSPLLNGQMQFLDDLSAITGATVFDPINKPFDSGSLIDLGPGVKSFESSRFRSVIIGKAEGPYMDGSDRLYEDLLLNRIVDMETLAKKPESELDLRLLNERIGKLTGGIAKLRVFGPSNGEIKEKRDRAEDAVCAVKGAVKYGCLPGGGWALLKVISSLDRADPVIDEVLCPALAAPIMKLLHNCGLNDEECVRILDPVIKGIVDNNTTVYDAYGQKHGDAYELGILDSTQAVIEAIRNSISIASLLGTLGGVVVFARDKELERREASDTQSWLRDANSNPADDRP